MKRREFTKLSEKIVVTISTSGFIRIHGDIHKGECETTIDILRPFCRPYSPDKDDLVFDGITRNVIELPGIIRHKICKTPLNLKYHHEQI